jgi:hypothetical protein
MGVINGVIAVVLSTLCLPAHGLSTPSRMGLTRRAALAIAPSALLLPALPARAAEQSVEALISELREVQSKLKPLPALLDNQEWDAVRTVLKTPPVANLWNLGPSRSTIRKLAAARDNDVDMVEYVDEVAGALQLADQFTYDNVFVYTQPGNGKLKIKEPKDQLKLASKKIDEVLELATK